MDRQFAILFTFAVWAISKQYDRNYRKGELCLVGSLVGTERGSGTGNIFFELLSFVAIARHYKRIPVLRDEYTNARLQEMIPIFPSLKEIIPHHDPYCGKEKRLVLKTSKCCVFDQNIIPANNLTDDVSLDVDFYYLQSYKYFQNVSSLFVKRILRGSEGVRHIAERELIDPRIIQRSPFNICIHIRRGDYMLSWRHEPTRADFTVAIVEHLRQKYSKFSPTVIVLGNDPLWAEDILAGLNVHVVPYSPLNPPNVDWEFSQMYCDVVGLTASASTYGWWMAYMSRGGRVYYNRKFSQPYGIEMEMNSTDFFPPSWTSLYLKHGRIYES